MTCAFNCPQCGDAVEQLCEGYCEPCLEARQNELFAHLFALDRWERMSDAGRDAEIRDAMEASR
jgi:predicted DNA-binding transcriptional regulator YafY